MWVADSSAVFFKSFETKQRLYEFRVAPEPTGYDIPPGRYLVRGGYARLWTAYDTIAVSP